MITNRLAVNATKTQVMCLTLKRTQMIKKGEEFDLQLNIKEKRIREQKKGVLLGLNWDRDKEWTGHVEQVL